MSIMAMSQPSHVAAVAMASLIFSDMGHFLSFVLFHELDSYW
ncbi:MAG: hypothetical protein BWX90_00953 [bacterium ADurb.Bin132]|nr:MAG: hypothetical protein BWX90_00953 [bacterium ADurb.Bin132]